MAKSILEIVFMNKVLLEHSHNLSVAYSKGLVSCYNDRVE
jgi:hypothetical protein